MIEELQENIGSLTESKDRGRLTLWIGLALGALVGLILAGWWRMRGQDDLLDAPLTAMPEVPPQRAMQGADAIELRAGSSLALPEAAESGDDDAANDAIVLPAGQPALQSATDRSQASVESPSTEPATSTMPLASAVTPDVAPLAGTTATSGGVEPIDDDCPPDFPVKGNRRREGTLIYHLPGGANYQRTKPEMCFATPEAAEAAGYRRAMS